ncbi:hypothetical protein F4824DRAFT_306787 [Ustulina deusta]|nr:hypothetical protein F4824DRAFT_306787 [Ustulina deusta]
MRYLAVSARPLVCALGIIPLVGASSILTFSDASCRTSSGTITVLDSTGSGECTMLTSGYSSFMIGTLGSGCTVTIYGDDPKDPICSATNNTLAQTTVCYNSTWTYFSVDLCSPLTTISDSTSAPTTSTTSTTTPTAAPESATNKVNVGAIVGGTISGVFVVASLVGAALYFFWFRPKHQRQMAELPTHPDTSPPGDREAYAMSDTHAKHSPYTVLPDEPQVYELSPQYIAEVHEQTHERHELPP